jgi:hypothetical protein
LAAPSSLRIFSATANSADYVERVDANTMLRPTTEAVDARESRGGDIDKGSQRRRDIAIFGWPNGERARVPVPCIVSLRRILLSSAFNGLSGSEVGTRLLIAFTTPPIAWLP